MLLFKQSELPAQDSQSLPISKRDKFRREIRQTSLKTRFEEIRKKLVEDLHSDVLIQTLNGLKGRYDEAEFQNMARLLEGNEDSVQFHERMATNNLEELLVSVMLRNELSKSESTQILSALSHLTYFSQRATQSLIGNDEFIDRLRRGLEKLTMETPEDLKYFNQALSLLMNIASEATSDFNHFLAESDLCLVLNRQLARTIVPARQTDNTYYRELVAEAREYALRFFRNVVQGLEGSGEVVARLMGDVLRDEENLLSHAHRTLLLLAESMGCGDKFWPALMTQPDADNYFIQICQCLDAIQGRCFNSAFLSDPKEALTALQRQNFFGAVSFLSELFYESDEYELAFVPVIENMLNGYMLAEFIIEAHKQNHHEHLVAGIKLVWQLSKTFDVTAAQLIVVRPADDPLALLKVIMDEDLMSGARTGRFCLDILQALLVKDRTMLPKLMELTVLEKVISPLEPKEHKDILILIKATELATEIMTAARTIGDGERVYALMTQMGIVKLVEKNTDHPDRTVYVKAEQFMESVQEEKKRQN